MTRVKRYNQSALAVLRRSSRFPTLAQMAAEIGLKHPTAMQRVETGRAEVSEERLRALAKALGISYARTKAAYLSGRRAYLRAEAERVNRELKDLLAEAS